MTPGQIDALSALRTALYDGEPWICSFGGLRHRAEINILQSLVRRNLAKSRHNSVHGVQWCITDDGRDVIARVERIGA